MPKFTTVDITNHNSQPPTPQSNSFRKVSRHMVIDLGLHYLHEAGADPICKVCIANGGSCCSGCTHLAEGVGCQLRNTSCTAWLCGFLKYLLYEIGELQAWNDFWHQVPGQNYRKDSTPEFFSVTKPLAVRNFRVLGKALASDLEELSHSHIAIGFIITLREKIDKNLDRLSVLQNDPKKQLKIKRNIQVLSSHFHRFKAALEIYKSTAENE